MAGNLAPSHPSSIDDILQDDYLSLPELGKRIDLSKISQKHTFSGTLSDMLYFPLSLPLVSGTLATTFTINSLLSLGFSSQELAGQNTVLIYAGESLGIAGLGRLIKKKDKRSIVYSPKVQGLVSSFFLTALATDRFTLPLDPKVVPLAALVGYSLGSDYATGSDKPLKPIDEKHAIILEKSRYYMLNHPLLTSGAVAIGLFSLASFLNRALPPGLSEFYEEPGMFSMIGGISSYFATKMAKANELVKRGFDDYKRRHYEPESLASKVKKAYDYLFEHPGQAALFTAGGIEAVGISSYIINMSKIYDPGTISLPQYLGTAAALSVFSAMAGILAYIGISAASWLLHTNSLTLMKESFLEKYHSKKNPEKAAAHLKKIMEIPTSKANERKNHLRLGDLYKRIGNREEALAEYYKAVERIPEKDDFLSNPFDALISLFDTLALPYTLAKEFFTTLKDGFVERKKEFLSARGRVDTDLESDISRFARQVRTFELEDADLNLRRTLYSNPLDPELHLLYGKFLESVGDSMLAQQEYKKMAEIILRDENLTGQSERVGLSRNYVFELKFNRFLKSTLIFKSAEDRSALEEELENLSASNQELGSKVAKPLLLTEHNGLHYIVIEHRGSETLYDILKAGRLTKEHLTDAIDYVLELNEVFMENGS